MSTLAKPRSEWTVSDIQNLIDEEIPESFNLDYKESDALGNTDSKKKEISKDVSAFANSGGGILIYGVVEEDQLPKSIDEGVDYHQISKEWLEDVITSRVQPRIEGLAIHQIRLSSESNRAIYVIEIPQAIHSAPHQASDYRYYKRHNFKSQPMEDYEVRDVRRRAIGPDLHVCLTDVALSNRNTDSNGTIHFNVLVENRSEEPALYSHFDLYIDEDLQLFNFPTIETFEPELIECRIGEFMATMTRYSISWVTPDKPPIWTGVGRKLYPTQEGMAAHIKANAAEFIVVVVVSSPQMPARTNVFKVKPRELVPAKRAELVSDVVFTPSRS